MDSRGLIAALAAGSVLATVAQGCGDESSGEEFAPAAEPAVAPEVRGEAAGKVAEVGGEIEGLAFDPQTQTLAAVAREPGILNLIDPRTLEVRREVEVGRGARHLQLAAPGGPMLVPAQFTDELWLVSPRSGRASSVVVGESTHDAAALGGTYFTADEGADTLSVVRSGSVVETLEAPVQPGAVEAVGGWIAVVAVAERVVSVYDPDSLELRATVPAGVGPTHAAGFGERLFVADTQGGTIIELRVARDEPIPAEQGVLAIGDEPYSLALDRRREILWVTATGRNEVVEVQLAGGRMELGRSYPTVRQPNSVTVDPRTGAVYVASRTEGQIQRIDPAKEGSAGG